MEYAEFNSAVLFSCFRLETPFLGKFGPKNQNCQCKLGVFRLIPICIINVDVHFFCFIPETPFSVIEGYQGAVIVPVTLRE